MKASTKRIVFVGIALVLLMAAVFVYSTYLAPEYSNIMNLRGTLAGEQQQYTQYQATVGKVKNISTTLAGGQSVQDRASLILPLAPDVSNFTNQILGVGQQSGLTVSSVSIQKASSVSSNNSAIKSVAVLRADMQVSGTYGQVKTFVQGIENNFLLMDVTDINLAYSSSSQSGSGPLSGTISVASYYQNSD